VVNSLFGRPELLAGLGLAVVIALAVAWGLWRRGRNRDRGPRESLPSAGGDQESPRLREEAPPAPESPAAALYRQPAPAAPAEARPAPADAPRAHAPTLRPAPPAVAPPVQEVPATAAAPAEEGGEGVFARLRRGLGRTSDNLVQGMGNLFLGRREIDDELLEEMESRLLMADVGVEATMEIIDRLTQRVSRRELTRPEALREALKKELLALLKPCEQPLEVGGRKPWVILMVGVNGAGKTTTIGKLARRYLAEGRSVMLAAGDTFRAAAVEQLQVWGERNGVPVIAQHTGADSASVIYDALQAATSRGVDVLIADTAGRLHNKDNLMGELKKVVRVMGKLDPSAPHEVMLVLDAGTGQNALTQATQFQQWVGVSGIALTKLDGTAKGGVIFAIAKKLGLPIRFIGVGEQAEDLRPFEAEPFIQALFAEEEAAA
jgi:fused signal recognition particle receptor